MKTAQWIGRVQGRTPLRVSMEALLELARVSERYGFPDVLHEIDTA